MSLFHYIRLKKAFDVDALNDKLESIAGIEIEERGENCYYYWIAGKSTRGFDITLEDDQIEIRNTVLSNKTDYLLTNEVTKAILALTKTEVVDEEGDPVIGNLLFDEEKIRELEIRGCEVTRAISKEHEDLAIFGPVRKVHFGKRLYETYKHLEGEKLRDSIFEIVLHVQFSIPDYGFGDVLNLGDGESKKVIKVLGNSGNLLIDKYDYIGIVGKDESLVLITNSALNKILPNEWNLVDEFTIVAPKISPESFGQLVEKAKAFNVFEEVLGKGK